MKRAALEKNLTRTAWRLHLRNHVQRDVRMGGQKGVQCQCEFQVGRFRKGQRIGGCGQSRCYLCHGEKLLGIPKHRDRVMLVRGLEW